MSNAGLTRGGFYNHFRNKEELLLSSVEAYGECNPADRWDGVELDFEAEPARVAVQMVEAYLSPQHLQDIAGHCPLVALPADAAHAGPELARAYRTLLDRMIAIFERGTGDPEKALTLTAMCVGAMLLGRTVDDLTFGQRMLKATLDEARELLDR